jgi:glycosyltransferase involved in cell wall biosynthesis
MHGLGILIFSEPSYPKHPGGAGKVAHIYAAALARRGHSVWILCPGSTPEKELIEGVEVHRVPLGGQPPTPGTRSEEQSTARGLLSYAQRELPLHRIDVTIDLGGFLSYFFYPGYELRKRFGIPLVVYFQMLQDHVSRDPARYIELSAQHPEALFPDRHKERSQCFAVRAADVAVCLTRDEAGVVERLYSPRRLLVLPNPVDPALLSVSPDPEFRHRLAPSGEPLLLFAGRLEDHVKGRDIVRRAFRRAVSQRRDLRLALMGNTGDGYFRSLGVSAIDLGWVRDPAAAANILAAADLLLMPSRYEPFGMMCIEAMAMGTPAIASPVGGLKEIVNHGVDGVLLTGHTPSKWAGEMAQWILQLTAPQSDLPRMARNAWQSARERFGADALAAWLEEICREAIAARAEKPGIEPPRLDAARQEHFRARLAGTPEAAAAGELLLARFQSGCETRCLACSRVGIAETGWRLRTLMRRWPQHNRNPSRRRAILKLCPMGLLQIDELETMARASGLVRPWERVWSKISAVPGGLAFRLLGAIHRARLAWSGK